MLTELGLKVNVGAYPEVLVETAEKLTVPLKLLTGATEIVTGGMVPPAATVTVGVVVEIEKSGQLELLT
jgi:hypothetical protein